MIKFLTYQTIFVVSLCIDFFQVSKLAIFFQFSSFFDLKSSFFRPVNSSFSSLDFLARNSLTWNSLIPRSSRGMTTRKFDIKKWTCWKCYLKSPWMSVVLWWFNFSLWKWGRKNLVCKGKETRIKIRFRVLKNCIGMIFKWLI